MSSLKLNLEIVPAQLRSWIEFIQEPKTPKQTKENYINNLNAIRHVIDEVISAYDKTKAFKS